MRNLLTDRRPREETSIRGATVNDQFPIVHFYQSFQLNLNETALSGSIGSFPLTGETWKCSRLTLRKLNIFFQSSPVGDSI